MRELKLRAWSIKKRKFLNIDTLYCANGKVCAVVEDGVVYDIEDVVLDQYTDLKDKNGKEIYEGDIVASSYFGKDRILKVVFYEGCFCLCITRLEIPQVGGVYYFRQGSRFRPQDDYAVIGNIHENPELLEGE